MRGQPGHNSRPHIQLLLCYLGMDAWMTSQLNVALIRNARGPLVSLTQFFDMLSMDVCTTRH